MWLILTLRAFRSGEGLISLSSGLCEFDKNYPDKNFIQKEKNGEILFFFFPKYPLRLLYLDIFSYLPIHPSCRTSAPSFPYSAPSFLLPFWCSRIIEFGVIHVLVLIAWYNHKILFMHLYYPKCKDVILRYA